MYVSGNSCEMTLHFTLHRCPFFFKRFLGATNSKGDSLEVRQLTVVVVGYVGWARYHFGITIRGLVVAT